MNVGIVECVDPNPRGPLIVAGLHYSLLLAVLRSWYLPTSIKQNLAYAPDDNLHIDFIVQLNFVAMHAPEAPVTRGTLLYAYFDILVLNIYVVSNVVKEEPD